MTVIDMRNFFHDCDVELIEINDEVIYYAEEKVEEGQEVILVDHNEFNQSVDGIEKAKILGVTDHHRIANFETSEPLFYYAQPVGCTSTILFELYSSNNIEIPAQMAGVMLSAIISDTLLLKSPQQKKIKKHLKHLQK